jgi:cell division transport system permease protein
MPWVIAIMIALTVVAAASGLSLRNAALAASADLEGGLTVQIVNAAPAERTRQAAAALEVLRKTPGVAQASLVPQEELNRLVEPWLGTKPGDNVDALPIPALIDVRLAGAATPERVEALRGALRPVAASARVDAQSAWLAPVFGAIRALQWMAAGLIALLAFATAAAVLLAARTSLGTNRATIEVVHLLGATDRQIARIFQRSIAVDAMAGGAAGLALGLTAILLLSRQFAALGSGMVSAGGLGWADWTAIALIPVAGVVLAVITARVTVLRALGRML